jgi:NADPH-dependent 2,4-dienoyl-CoA reductase/sulfur reductase-like enzyme
MPRYLIVGGVAAGMSAAARLRRLDETAEIVVFERGGYISYANCGLPYYIGDVISARDQLLLQSPGGFRQRFKVDVRISNEVLAVDPGRQTVQVRDLAADRIYEEA